MLNVHITGEAEAKAAAAKLKAGTRDARREYLASARTAVRPAQQSVRAAIPRYLPSGYAPILQKSMRVVTAAAAGQVEIRGRARGRKGHERDIGRMERGTLRAPSWPGRRARKKWKWHGQRIPRGFFSEPIRKHGPEIRAAIVRAMHQVARRSV